MKYEHHHSGHRQRLRKRFLAAGQDGFYEHELLELLLFYARPVINTNDIAHALIEEFGSMGKALSADTEKLTETDGIGSDGALFIKLIYELGLRFMRSSHSFESLSTTEQLCRCMTEYFAGSDAELCRILCITPQSGLLRQISIPSRKILDGEATMKELAEPILRSNASRIVIGINHPGSLPVPVDDDYRIARIFGELLRALGIELRDCIICGSGKCFSMRGSGAFTF